MACLELSSKGICSLIELLIIFDRRQTFNIEKLLQEMINRLPTLPCLYGLVGVKGRE